MSNGRVSHHHNRNHHGSPAFSETFSPTSPLSDFPPTPLSETPGQPPYTHPKIVLSYTTPSPPWTPDHLDIQTCAIPEELFLYEHPMQSPLVSPVSVSPVSSPGVRDDSGRGLGYQERGTRQQGENLTRDWTRTMPRSLTPDLSVPSPPDSMPGSPGAGRGRGQWGRGFRRKGQWPGDLDRRGLQAQPSGMHSLVQ